MADVTDGLGVDATAPLVTHRFAVADARAAIETTAGNEGPKSAAVSDTTVWDTKEGDAP